MKNPVRYIRIKFRRSLRTIWVFRRMPVVIAVPVVILTAGAVWVLSVLLASKAFPFIAVGVFGVLWVTHTMRRDERLIRVAGYDPREVFLCEYTAVMALFLYSDVWRAVSRCR